ncbi:metallophosphoesterase family protein [Thiocapsa marina]|nr:metallophosphoesterase [Thiocapsa marina]
MSDFHLHDSRAWAQDIVLSAMCADIERRRADAGVIDFVLATGDLAYAGKADEYALAAAFFEEVTRVAGVARERIFCIPGNHDVERDRQRTCFSGARYVLQSQNDIDSFLGSPEELETLLQRQANFRRFQETYFSRQEKKWTHDGLGYVSAIVVEDISIAIVGINTAWLSEGGSSDHGKLLAGERQVIDALSIAGEADANLVIAMGHHPFHLLNEFDRRPVQRRIEEVCHFYHCGHLHDPESHHVVHSGTHCLTIAAGSSFESRHAHNAYSIISLDVMQARQTVKTIQYKPTDGAFSYENNKQSTFVINAVRPYSLDELARAIAKFCTPLASLAHYLSALLIEAQAEMPIAVGNGHVFGTLDFLLGQAHGDLKAATVAFMAIRNPLRLFGGQMILDDFFARYGAAVERYGILLNELCTTDPGLRQKLGEREAEMRVLAGVEPLQPFAHSLALLQDLATYQDWESLRAQAERLLDSPERTVAIEAQRMLALCLRQSTEATEKFRAIELYNEITADELAAAADFAALASLQADAEDHEAAKKAVLTGMNRFPEAVEGFAAVGQKIVEATGDRAFRDKLSAKRAERRTA